MKKYLISILSAIATVGCLVAYNIIGSEIAADGMLVEPFYLIPLAYAFALISVVSLAIAFILPRKKPINLN